MDFKYFNHCIYKVQGKCKKKDTRMEHTNFYPKESIGVIHVKV